MRELASWLVAAAMAALACFGAADAKVTIAGHPFETDCLNQVLEHRKDPPGTSHTPSCDVIVFGLLSHSTSQALTEQDRLNVLFSLHRRGWIAEDVTFDPGRLWADLALALIGTGQDKEARDVVHDVIDPYGIAAIMVDKDFGPLLQSDPGWFQPRDALARRVAQLRQRAADEPDRIAWTIALARMLSQGGDDAQALAVLDDALPGAAPVRRKFADAERLRFYALEVRALTLQRLGRVDEAVEQMSQAVKLDDLAGRNVDQKIALASLYDGLGRPREALAAASDVQISVLTSYGVMARTEVRAAAYAQLGDAPNLAKAVAYGRDHAAVAPRLYQRILLDADDEDAAAAEYIARLQDPEARSWALLDLQDWRTPPNAGPFALEIERRRLKVRSRPDVQAAIPKVGRVEQLDLAPTY